MQPKLLILKKLLTDTQMDIEGEKRLKAQDKLNNAIGIVDELLKEDTEHIKRFISDIENGRCL